MNYKSHFIKIFSSILTGMQGAAVILPVSLGSVYFVFSNIAPSKMGYGIFASCLSLFFVHVLAAWNQRPVGYASRFFEAATLIIMVEQLNSKFSEINIQITPEIVLFVMSCLTTLAGIFFGLLWVLKTEHLMRFIPSPVYIGFINSTAIILFVSQSKSLWLQVSAPNANGLTALLLFLVTLLTIFAINHKKTNWPATIIGLMFGSLTHLVIYYSYQINMPMLNQTSKLTMPYNENDFSTSMSLIYNNTSLVFLLIQNGLVLGFLIFLNTAITRQLSLQNGDKPESNIKSKVIESIGFILAGLTAAPPVSGSPACVKAMHRNSEINTIAMLTIGFIASSLYLFNILAFIPLAVLCALLCFEAWSMWDRLYIKNLLSWLRGKRIERHQKEDVLLITTVIASSLLINMFAALFAGFLLGLLLHAQRNTRSPVQRLISGVEINSNCARSKSEVENLKNISYKIKVFELDSHQYFGSSDSLNKYLRNNMTDCKFAILDWRFVRSIDTSIASMLIRLQKWSTSNGISMLHAGTNEHSHSLHDLLNHYLPNSEFFQDLDRALETAENRLLQEFMISSINPRINNLDDSNLFFGLSAADRSKLRSRMSSLIYEPNEILIEKGEGSDFILLIREGTGSVVLNGDSLYTKRLAGVRAGALIGEVGFFDRSPRSATVIADTRMRVDKLDRKDFDELSISDPRIIQTMIQNIALDLATRLRRTSIQAVTRH